MANRWVVWVLFGVGGVGVAQRPVGAGEVGQVEAVVPVDADADVAADERREPFHVGIEFGRGGWITPLNRISSSAGNRARAVE